jgi:hypothetical protein
MVHLVKNRGELTGIFFTVALGYRERMSIVSIPDGVFEKAFFHCLRLLKLGHFSGFKQGFSK